MLPAVLVVQALLLIAVVILLLRTPEPPVAVDPRQLQLPDQIARVDARAEALDTHVRGGLAQMRTDLATEAQLAREANSGAAIALRTEITNSISTLGTAINAGLDSFRGDNKASAETLRAAVQQNLDTLAQRLSAFVAESTRNHMEAQTALHNRLTELSGSNTAHQEKLRTTVGEALLKLNTDNAAKLEEMRATVDEKLHATLHTRLTESFGQVSDQLTKVHTGLGEMSKLTDGVNDLSRIFTNVKSRGTIGEVMLGTLLKQMLAPSQFEQNARVKPDTQEVVEYAVKFPTPNGETLLPIDSKFPREAWERLETAYETGEDIAAAGKAFETAIRIQAKLISDKYISTPATTPFAIMFLPTEGLYAEIVRRDGLQDELQRNFHVTIAGPSTLSAILISFQLGFHMLNLQKKGDDVWKVLAATRTEFGKFGDLMDSMEKQVGTVQNTIQKLGVRTRAIKKNLSNVSESEAAPDNLLTFDGIAPRLSASGEEE